jgi:hypothetical protein
LTLVYAFAAGAGHEVTIYGTSGNGGLEKSVVIGLERPDEFSSTQIIKLVTVADTSGQPDTKQTILMFFVDLSRGRPSVIDSVLALEKHKANVGLSNDSVPARQTLLLVNGIKIIGNDKIRKWPYVGSGGIAIVFGANDVGKIGIAVFVDLQWRVFDCIQTLIKTNERSNGKPSSGLINQFTLPLTRDSPRSRSSLCGMMTTDAPGSPAW